MSSGRVRLRLAALRSLWQIPLWLRLCRSGKSVVQFLCLRFAALCILRLFAAMFIALAWSPSKISHLREDFTTDDRMAPMWEGIAQGQPSLPAKALFYRKKPKSGEGLSREWEEALSE
jgi:hypothetical protein